MWLTCLTVIRFNSIQWESNSAHPLPLPSPPSQLHALSIQFISMAMRCDAIRFDFVLIKSERLATSFSSVLFRRRLSNLLICLSALVAVVNAPVVATQLAKKSMPIYSITSVEPIRFNIYLFTFLSHSPSSLLSPSLSPFWFARLICIFWSRLMKTNACGSVSGRSSALA